MPFYHRQGKVPDKRHITFYKEGSKELYREELYSTLGFSGEYSLKYHAEMPTQVMSMTPGPAGISPIWAGAPLTWHLGHTSRLSHPSGDQWSSRVYLMRNADVRIFSATPSHGQGSLFKNAFAHEMLFIHQGEGSLHTEFGRLPFSSGDHLVLPKGVVFQLTFQGEDNKVFGVESQTAFDFPKRYLSQGGQLLEHAPFSERDLRLPVLDEVEHQTDVDVLTLAGDELIEMVLKHHPFDLIGWDGCAYPFAFNMKDFAPIVGKIHQPPPVHQVFQTKGAVVCNFVPRLFDFHEAAIPAPYFHSNIDSDEVLYYVDGEFMSRKGIESGSITLHPMGLPHGPQPGKTEGSIGKKDTQEWAVMVDTFARLHPTLAMKDILDETYPRSWLG